MSNTALFISDGNYLKSDIRGGVQLCTRDYMHYIQMADFEVKTFAVKPVINLLKRIKIKLGINVYDHYDAAPYAKDIADTINNSGIKVVFLNQLSLCPWVAVLKKMVADDVKFIGLSHGNESADYLNDITRQGNTSLIQTWKLGRLLVKENGFFNHHLDGVIVLSEQETAINQWLGAHKVLYLPQILQPRFIDSKPISGLAGFAGTIDHLPNKLGITYLADELQKASFTGKIRLIGGPRSLGEAFANKYPFIDYLGPVSDEQQQEEMRSWSVVLNPVFWYGRGATTKLAQAINWGLPCLTTPAGSRGYQLVDSHIVTADNTPQTLAQALISMLSSGQNVLQLTQASRNNAEAFKIEPHITRLKEFIENITGGN